MKFEILYSGKYDYSIVIEGESIEEVREKAFYECDTRGWERENCHSICIEE